MSFLKKKGFIFCTGAGLVISAVMCMLLLAMAAFCMHKQLVGQASAWVISNVCSGLSVLCASAVITKSYGRQALLLGVSMAAGFVMIALIVRLVAGGSDCMGKWILWLAAATFGGGLLGALIGTGKNMRAKRRHKRIR